MHVLQVKMQYLTNIKNKTINTIEAKDPIKALQEVISHYKVYEHSSLSGFYAGAVGFFPYDIIRYYENIYGTTSESHSIEFKKPNPLNIPDLLYVLPSLMLWFDHTKGMAKIIANIFIESGDTKNEIIEKYNIAQTKIKNCLFHINHNNEMETYRNLAKPKFEKEASIQWNCNTNDDEFKDLVEKTKEYIRAGDIFQTVLSKRFSIPYEYDPLFLYRCLRVTNPSPYMFYLNFEDIHLVGSSPEILVKKEGECVSVRPIAGTIHRGKNSAEDIQLGEQLLADTKEVAEHTMLVDLGRNDIGKISQYGTVKVDELMIIEKYSHVMHIVSNVAGILQKNKTAFDCLLATFPAGTVSGAPKVRSMQIIEELEKEVRGCYSGCIGLISFNGDMDMAITLRTMTITNKTLYLQAGAGIVFDSIPTNENQEVNNKLAALFKATELFYSGKLESII